ncbi:MAG: hypothetical protein HKN91_12525 [Acidimicrobiia bacterium]|nr:hypothetical protein [Acidimicrobiia bacterium]
MTRNKNFCWISAALLVLAGLVAAPASADFVINDDLIVDGSACIGFDCVNGESFGFDTIRLKEHNLRIKFDDTSTASSFPRNDWQLTANASANGGASKFSIDDISGGRTPFTVEANARSHSLYVDDGGRIGSRTSTPSTEIHTIDGDTPTLRLQQDGSSGFEPQTWDVAGNETNFFIRDVTNGSTLPFRIRPQAPTSSIFVDVDGDVGLGTAAPLRELHVNARDDDNVQVKLTHTASGTTDSADGAQFALAGDDVFFTNREAGDLFFFTDNAQKLLLDAGDEHEITGNLTVSGDIDSGGTTTVPDYVFEPDYPLMPLDRLASFLAREKHLPNVPSAAEIKARGSVNMSKMQMTLLEKVEELTLYTLAQQEEIAKLRADLAELKQQD